MEDKDFKEQSQQILDAYQEAMKIPLDIKNIYLGMNIESLSKECPEKYLIVEWNDDFASLSNKYPDFLFYSTFLLWEGVEIFLSNLENDKKVTVIKDV